ncbi:MAG: TRAP transporter small permease subunit [Pseudomonadota bacterium]
MGRLITKIGRVAAWFLPAVLALQIIILVLREGFGIAIGWADDLSLALHGTCFMLVAAWTLSLNRHVRIDVLDRSLSRRWRKTLDRIGALCLLLPMMGALLVTSLPYVARSWQSLEGTAGTDGLPGLFIVKTAIPIFAVLMLIAGFMAALRKDSPPSGQMDGD